MMIFIFTGKYFDTSDGILCCENTGSNIICYITTTKTE